MAAPGGPGPGGALAGGVGGAFGQAMGEGGGPISKRNPLMVFGLSQGLMILANVLTGVLPLGLWFVASLCSLAGLVMFIIFVVKMGQELANYVQDPEFPWWHILIPIYGLWIQVPKAVTKAKQKSGAGGEAKMIAWYIFLPMYALPTDLNEVAERVSGGAGAPAMGGPGGGMAPPGAPGGPPPGGGFGGPPPGGPGGPPPGGPGGPPPGGGFGGPPPGGGFGGPPPGGMQ